MSSKKNVTQELTKKFIQTEYHTNGKSFAQIAKELGTYTNKILRAAKKFGIRIKDKSETQVAALKSGRAIHPTQDKGHSTETREKISEKVADSWDKITIAERQRRSEMSKEQWKNMSEAERHNLIQAAQKAIRETSKTGSKLEKALLEHLLGCGYDVQFHKEQFLLTERLQLDLFLPSNDIAIEVDGPSHHKAVWGQKNLNQTQRADKKKEGLVLGRGLTLIRVKQTKPYSQHNERTLLKLTANAIQNVIDKKVKPNAIYIVED